MNADRYADALTSGGGRSILTMARRFDHPRGEVWEALTDPARLSQWFPFQVGLDPRPGGAISFTSPGGEERGTTGTVTDLVPPGLFAFDRGPDHLSWSVAEEGAGSVLSLVHTFDDRAEAASFAAGWDACMAALGRLLDGGPVQPPHDTAEAHDAYVRLFGLDRGTADSSGAMRTVRFERRLTAPAAKVWKVLCAGIEPVPGLPVPAGFTAPGVPAGHVSEVHPPHFLGYGWDDGATVTWELREGTGRGARLVLTQTGPKTLDTDEALAAWRSRIEALAERLREE
ncbi:SRPBCC domain-containing protein [Streptomyces sp. NRRL F-5126]|uniref:SRPBCC domain-containing protein n=1 Tax=Streptomyces sp. NRRL F-5126 TaxID=1463857 RepID=UPI0004C9F8B9|nr:SRPBCC domain-containing protein [Streptomyces sp. NRRL F-5126]